MNQRMAIGVMVLALAVALAIAWAVLRPGRGGRTNADAIEHTTPEQACGTALQMPMEEGPPDQPEVEGWDAPDPVVAPAPTTLVPVLDTPDYSPAIRRGGAFIEFEVCDARGTRVPLQGHGAKLWRRIGNYWLAEQATIDPAAGVIRCDGLGEQDIPPTGLEPGTYELELTSPVWGNIRHEFSVARDERRTERLITPHTKVNVCFRFTDAEGKPVQYLPARPSVTTTAEPLEEVARPGAPTVKLRHPPGVTHGGSGMYWSSHGSGDGYPRKYDKPPLYATDNGAWWVTVFAGGTNTVTFGLQELWGQAEYQIADSFTSRSEITVQLPTVPDFAVRVLEWGEPIEGWTPGGRDSLDEADAPRQQPQFDPYTAVVHEGTARAIVEANAPVQVRVEMSLNGTAYWNVMYRQDTTHWYDLSGLLETVSPSELNRPSCTAPEGRVFQKNSFRENPFAPHRPLEIGLCRPTRFFQRARKSPPKSPTTVSRENAKARKGPLHHFALSRFRGCS
jgi:hypothetical protein